MLLSKLKKKEYYLLSRKKKTAGRNNRGRITVAHQGGGHKQLYRNISFEGNFSSGIVTNFEYDPNRTAFLAKICFLKNNKKSFYYVLAPQNLQILDPLYNTTTDTKKIINPEDITSTKYIGSCYFLSELAVGDSIYNIELTPTKGSQLVRAGGTFAIILQKTEDFILVKMPSGELRKIPSQCKAFLGALANDTHNKVIWKKAGKSRWLNIRPTVRGVAKNPIDHPHGGNTSGGCHPVTPWAKLTKGKPTRSKKKQNPLIVKFANKNKISKN